MIPVKTICFSLFIFLFLLSACSPENVKGGAEETQEQNQLEQIFCTADVQECPDGSFVGRNPLNNCEFKECS